MRNMSLLQMRQEGTHCKGLQGEANNEEQKSQGRLKRQERGGFW